MAIPSSTNGARDSGQSLVETALILPLVLVLTFNAINVGYFFFVALNLSTAPRQGAEYSIQGNAGAQQTSLPTADNVQTLVDAGITGAIPSTQTFTRYQVCTLQLGVSGTGAGQIANCQQYNGHPAIAPDADPEAPFLVLNRVDIQYQVAPLIPGAWFNLVPAPNFHRYVQMRAME